jgi:serine protease AprX
LIGEGVVVTVAAGNSGRNQIVPPATAPGAIVVGGYDDQNTTNRDQWFAFNNNYGHDINGRAKPDVIAPAAWLPSPVLGGSDMERDAVWLAPLLYQENAAALMDGIINEGYTTMNMPGEANLLPMYRVQRMVQERIHQHKLVDQYHQHVDGTSVAAPLVAAVAAQMLEVNPALKPKQVRRILMETAIPLMNMPLDRQGAGIINPALAVQIAREERA